MRLPKSEDGGYTEKIGAFYTESNWRTKANSTFTKARAFKETFKNFLFYDVIILADQRHVNYWKACKYAFDHYSLVDRNVKIITYEEYGLNFYQFSKFVNHTIADIVKEDYNVFQYMGSRYKRYFTQPLKDEEIKKTNDVVYSLMDASFQYNTTEYRSYPAEKQIQLAFRGMEPEHYKIVKEILKNTNWIDLGDSRKISDGPDLLNKLELIRRSKFYIGTKCGWSQWAHAAGTKSYIIFNRRPTDYNEEMRNLDTKTKFLILGGLMWTS